MGRIRVSVHPLFFAVALYFALTGRLFVFLAFTFSAVIHELGHSVAAERAGYRLDKVCLMPFGAVVKGDIEGLNFKDEALIFFAGPLVNIMVGTVFVATWWVFPEAYAFTDTAAFSSFAIAVVNLIPVIPLDGGRIFFALVAMKTGRKKAERISAVVSVIFAVILFALFILSVFYGTNVSLLFFSLIILLFDIC